MTNGPPDIEGFFLTCIIIGFFLIMLRRHLVSKRTQKEIKPMQSHEASVTLPDQTNEQFQIRLDRLVGRTASTPVVPIPDEAILFRQHIPPHPNALSYWGGVPLVPQDFIWPSFTTPDGSERALHFIQQIDCGAIPDAERLGLPESGLLYFFVDLEWGAFWECRVLHIEGDPRLFVPAAIPATLPHTYAEREAWRWVRRDEDWPRLLPRWSFDPVLVRGANLPPPDNEDEEEERKFWPGTIDLNKSLATIPDAIVKSHYYQNRYVDGVLVRPFVNYPHDWQAVRIAMGELSQLGVRGIIASIVKRGDMTEAEGDTFVIAFQSSIDQWTARAIAANPAMPLSQFESDEVWKLFIDFQKVTDRALREAVDQSIDATLSDNLQATNILPEEALALVRSRHAIASEGQNGLHIIGPDHLLGPPSYVQGDAADRLGEWRLLLEMSSRDQIGHLFSEGVYQFWIRPEDLAKRRFDRVQINGAAY